jgi:hypothetical protein
VFKCEFDPAKQFCARVCTEIFTSDECPTIFHVVRTLHHMKEKNIKGVRYVKNAIIMLLRQVSSSSIIPTADVAQ